MIDYEARAIELGWVKTFTGRWRYAEDNANESDYIYKMDAQEAVAFSEMKEYLKNLRGEK